jgi:gamma-glutamyltranspeptidase
LEALSLEHGPELSAIGLEPSLWEVGVERVTTAEEMNAYIARAIADAKTRAFAVRHRATGRLAGATRYMNMELAHRRHGRLAWSRLFKPAIDLAEQGFPVSPRLHAQIAGNRDLYAQLRARDYFYPAGAAAPVGYVLKNPQLAAVLRRVASQGVDVFYQGEIAKKIVGAEKMRKLPITPITML